MTVQGSIVIVGGSGGLGRAVAEHYAAQGRDVVITSRDAARAHAAAAEIGGSTVGVALDLSRPEGIRPALAGVGQVAHLALVGLERDESNIRAYDLAGASSLVISKLVGYPETVSALLDRMSDRSSVVLFGGSAKDRPYPGSFGVTTANNGVVGLVKVLAVECAPVRVNSIHPAPVGDSPIWMAKPQAVLDGITARTPTGRMVTTADVVSGTVFLFENEGVNGEDLGINGGWLLK
jgi:NAD(P)-dependent dehydrogenase (short-subunit alcohol dehydrogenase family)